MRQRDRETERQTNFQSYLELFYEGIDEKKKAAQLFFELAKNGANLHELAENGIPLKKKEDARFN